ncbi:hypothetical protein JZ751_000482 [Albula glossodonta]|uniref:5'-nucleotidase n=1 Tax=Albula glossodonta TaxID=121402 RepID=A0A8T2PWH5_9TELE|nr:hypothetical protein JZ751_000482 [Albula glossodonta]
MWVRAAADPLGGKGRLSLSAFYGTERSRRKPSPPTLPRELTHKVQETFELLQACERLYRETGGCKTTDKLSLWAAIELREWDQPRGADCVILGVRILFNLNEVGIHYITTTDWDGMPECQCAWQPLISRLTEHMLSVNMVPKPENAVTIAVSTRVLFRTETEQKVFEQNGIEEYLKYQMEHENEPFAPGPAFAFVKALETVNAQLRELYPDSEELFDIVLVTYNHAHVGGDDLATSWPHSKPPQLRSAFISLPDRSSSELTQEIPGCEAGAEDEVSLTLCLSSQGDSIVLRAWGVSSLETQTGNAGEREGRTCSGGPRLDLSLGRCGRDVARAPPDELQGHASFDLFIERFCMTGGSSPIGYLKAYHTNLYLSADSEKVREALEEGIAAATMFMPEKMTEVSETQLRVAFDGDAVLFSDESERIFKAHGLDKFFEHEKEHENMLLDHGPLKGFLESLGKLQKKFYAKGKRLNCPIRTYLVTARSAASSGIRALKTLRAWGLETDEALFLAGAPKGPMLEKIRPHIYFDDQMFHVQGAAEMGTIAAHVPYGVAQKYPHRKKPVDIKEPSASK